ncbi:hypothetical protein, partial [Limosilactobacillus reuteri]|uniref:hypothetical protein n=1 Tax=Limosilactobacillus reuteri TaxID=1598 RepID=UPI001E392085
TAMCALFSIAKKRAGDAFFHCFQFFSQRRKTLMHRRFNAIEIYAHLTNAMMRAMFVCKVARCLYIDFDILVVC